MSNFDIDKLKIIKYEPTTNGFRVAYRNLEFSIRILDVRDAPDIFEVLPFNYMIIQYYDDLRGWNDNSVTVVNPKISFSQLINKDNANSDTEFLFVDENKLAIRDKIIEWYNNTK